MEDGTNIRGLVCDADLDSARSTSELVPLVLGASVLEVRHELDSAEEHIVAHVPRPVARAFGLLSTKVALQGYLRVPRHIAGDNKVYEDERVP